MAQRAGRRAKQACLYFLSFKFENRPVTHVTEVKPTTHIHQHTLVTSLRPPPMTMVDGGGAEL
jgi:hypothetical protein